jgi:uncharacterized protein YyaL (SSP411 family)
MRFISLVFFTLLSGLLVLSCGQEEAARRNVLGEETSPYLLQHAENPVHWQPWGDAIWEMARKENKLVLISIGYSSCHWCHVMEAETFENDSVASLMNSRFINVKVDREERPDVDQVYMTAVQLMTGSGGWPLNVVVLPNGKPVYGGTYHTRERWLQVLDEVSSRFQSDPEKLSAYADRVAQGVAEVNLVPDPGEGGFREGVLETALTGWRTRWDLDWGGNSETQKFMLPPTLDFLMAYSHLSGDSQAGDHLERTLDRMALGGVFDQVGGGFYRYSTDPRWHIPHFEKMLYDNAQMLGVFAKAYSVFSKPEYKRVVERTFEFLKRDMKSTDGGYYAALDADTEGAEGKYYLWQAGELEELLGEDFPLFAAYYSIERDMAWEDTNYVPFRKSPDQAFAKEQNLSLEELQTKKKRWQSELMRARSARVFPGRDDKIITSWNALLISGLVDAYEALGDAIYLGEARGLYAFILAHAAEGERLRHSYKEGDTRSEGFLEDYAFMARAAFRMYQATGEPEFLDQAEGWMEAIEKQFPDPNSPLFRYREDSELIAAIVKTDDGVMPSPNTVLAGLYLDLGHFFYRPEYLEKGKEMVLALQDRFLQVPDNYAGWGQLLLRHQYPFYEVAIAGEGADALRAEMAREYLPDALLVSTSKPSDLPLFQGRFDSGQTRIFVCRDHSCRLPVTSVDQALTQIRGTPVLFP